MCQILGISYKKPTSWHKAWDKFRHRAAQNPDGWGIAYGDINNLAVVKQPERADRSALAAALGNIELPASIMIGHVRLASRGNLTLVNTHPFVARLHGRNWALVHNGTLHNSFNHINQHGRTDSEAFFLRLIDRLAGCPDNISALAKTVATETAESSPCGKLNFLMTDGKYLFAHSNQEGTLYQLCTRTGVMFCTAPLTRQRGWGVVELDKIHVYQGGKPVCTVPVRQAKTPKTRIILPSNLGRGWRTKSMFAH